ncbi:MAG: ATP-binding protein [Campylobacterales bacterium]
MQNTQINNIDALVAVVENSDDIIVVKDLDLRVVATNMAFAKASGYSSPSELIGKTDAEIFGVDENSEPIRSYMIDEKAAQKLPRGESIKKVEPVLDSDGSTRYVYTKKYPIYDGENVVATGNISVDVTHHVELEKVQNEALAQQHKLAEIGKMINVITHQWKQPLNIIMMTASDVDDLEEQLSGRDDGILDSLLECRDEIETQVDFLSQTINDFRDFLSESKKKEDFSVAEVVKKVARLLAPVFKKEEVALNINITNDFELLGLQNELQHAVFNILNNAKDIFKSRDVKEREIWLKVYKEDSMGVIDIEDSAGGVDEHLLPEGLFEINKSSHKISGRGLGLYITKMLVVDSFGGSIEVRNADKGAVFKITVPKYNKE